MSLLQFYSLTIALNLPLLMGIRFSLGLDILAGTKFNREIKLHHSHYSIFRTLTTSCIILNNSLRIHMFSAAAAGR